MNRVHQTLATRARLIALAGLWLVTALWVPARSEAADAIVIKLGTLAPESSVWCKKLRQMGEEWSKVSNGKVKLKIYPGGISGNEVAMVRKMRINQLQAVTLTTAGLVQIERSPLALQLPMAINSYEELDYVLERLIPILNKRIEDKGFKMLHWADAGWVYFFSRNQISTPAQLKQIALYSWDGDPEATQAFSKAGMRPVTVASGDVLPSLQTGMIEGFPSTPLGALSLQWFGLAKHMIDVKWAPMVGGTVVNLKVWNSIPADLQPKLLQIAHNAGVDLKNSVRQMDTAAIDEMKKFGLKVVPPSSHAEWQRFAESLYPIVRGTLMTSDMMDEVLRLHREFQGKRVRPVPVPARR